MIDRTEAQQIHDDLLRQLHSMVKSGTASAADRNVLRQMLKDNEFQGIVSSGGMGPVRSIGDVPFPPAKAAHAPDKAQAQG